MAKIIFSDNTLWGLWNFRQGVIKYFVSLGHEIILVAPHDNLCDLALIPENIRYIPVGLSGSGKNPITDIRYYKMLKTIYRNEKPDYIFHYTIKPNIYGTLAAHSLKIRSTAMVAGLGHAFTNDDIVSILARNMLKYALRFSEYVFVLNESNRDTLLRRRTVKEEKLLWLKGGEGVSLEKFSFQTLPNNKKPVFLMMARMLYEKGYTEYVNTARMLKDRAEFRIMGPIDSHPSAVQRETIMADSTAGFIKYIEYSPDVAAQISQADCIVLPSFYGEGLSRVLMEGLAMGKPIVCTDIAGCRETVDDGVNGFLCQPKDVASLINACEKFIQLSPEKRSSMGNLSRRKAEEIFDERLVFEKYQSVLASCK